jgi:hypothetical protein
MAIAVLITALIGAITDALRAELIGDGIAGIRAFILYARAAYPARRDRVQPTAAILMIQDLDRPLTGFITYSQQPMIDTATSINRFS